MNIRCLPLLLLGFALAGCGSRGAQSENAVRQGVLDYLAQRSDLNMKAMQVDVTSVSFRQDEADATVSFRPKGATGGGMQMRYTLDRQGDRWVVRGKGHSGAGQSPHGQQMPGTGGQSPHGQTPGSTPGEMPPGHPSVANPPGAK